MAAIDAMRGRIGGVLQEGGSSVENAVEEGSSDRYCTERLVHSKSLNRKRQGEPGGSKIVVGFRRRFARVTQKSTVTTLTGFAFRFERNAVRKLNHGDPGTVRTSTSQKLITLLLRLIGIQLH